MHRIARFGALLLLTAAIAPRPAAAAEPAGDGFDEWLRGLRSEARATGVKSGVLDRALRGLRPIPRVIELDRKQPEFTQTFWAYLNARVNETRISRGRQMLNAHAPLLARVERKYGVQPRFLVAFWGMETNYGKYTGSFPLVGALATLAFDPRRARFFRGQLLSALSLIDRDDVVPDAKASWAGAMGNMQFIPSTFRDFAVDFDGDGRRDHWNSLPDTFASAANFMARSGWQGERTWGREVSLAPAFDVALSGLSSRRSLAEWQALGVRRVDGRDLPGVDIVASLILPAGAKGPAFLVYQNFRAIMVWNRSILYAVAVGHLADRLAGGGAFLTPSPDKEVPLARADIAALQNLLTGLGFDTAGADGVAGPNTRNAIRAFQRSRKLPPDGYPSFELLTALRGAGR